MYDDIGGVQRHDQITHHVKEHENTQLLEQDASGELPKVPALIRLGRLLKRFVGLDDPVGDKARDYENRDKMSKDIREARGLVHEARDETNEIRRRTEAAIREHAEHIVEADPEAVEEVRGIEHNAVAELEANYDQMSEELKDAFHPIDEAWFEIGEENDDLIEAGLLERGPSYEDDGKDKKIDEERLYYSDSANITRAKLSQKLAETNLSTTAPENVPTTPTATEQPADNTDYPVDEYDPDTDSDARPFIPETSVGLADDTDDDYDDDEFDFSLFDDDDEEPNSEPATPDNSEIDINEWEPTTSGSFEQEAPQPNDDLSEPLLPPFKPSIVSADSEARVQKLREEFAKNVLAEDEPTITLDSNRDFSLTEDSSDDAPLPIPKEKWAAAKSADKIATDILKQKPTLDVSLGTVDSDELDNHYKVLLNDIDQIQDGFDKGDLTEQEYLKDMVGINEEFDQLAAKIKQAEVDIIAKETATDIDTDEELLYREQDSGDDDTDGIEISLNGKKLGQKELAELRQKNELRADLQHFGKRMQELTATAETTGNLDWLKEAQNLTAKLKDIQKNPNKLDKTEIENLVYQANELENKIVKTNPEFADTAEGNLQPVPDSQPIDNKKTITDFEMDQTAELPLESPDTLPDTTPELKLGQKIESTLQLAGIKLNKISESGIDLDQTLNLGETLPPLSKRISEINEKLKGINKSYEQTSQAGVGEEKNLNDINKKVDLLDQEIKLVVAESTIREIAHRLINTPVNVELDHGNKEQKKQIHDQAVEIMKAVLATGQTINENGSLKDIRESVKKITAQTELLNKNFTALNPKENVRKFDLEESAEKKLNQLDERIMLLEKIGKKIPTELPPFEEIHFYNQTEKPEEYEAEKQAYEKLKQTFTDFPLSEQLANIKKSAELYKQKLTSLPESFFAGDKKVYGRLMQDMQDTNNSLTQIAEFAYYFKTPGHKLYTNQPEFLIPADEDEPKLNSPNNNEQNPDIFTSAPQENARQIQHAPETNTVPDIFTSAPETDQYVEVDDEDIIEAKDAEAAA